MASTAPFRQFIVKVHSRCNLSCDYCYVYEHVDQSWRTRPQTMSPAIVQALAGRIAEHAGRHGLTDVRVVLHGGEPLLAGVDRLDGVVGAIRTALPSGVQAHFAVQTNGVLLDRAYLDFFLHHGVRVGISLDGGTAVHNAHRRFANGTASLDRVVRALQLLGSDRYREIYGGILCTIDLANDPVTVYESLLTFAPPMLHLRPPHGNWVHPPPGRPPGGPATPYGEWLIQVFERWYGARRRETGIRLFDSIIAMLLGGHSRTDEVGGARTGATTIETDGSIQRSDALKSAGDGLDATGLDVVRHSFDEVLTLPAVQEEQRSLATLPTPCRDCPVAGVCGGGLYAHRYHLTRGFDQRSVYCPDLYRLIGHIRERVAGDLRDWLTRTRSA